MSLVGKGMLAGLVATVALSILMVLKSATGMLPDLNAISMLSQTAHRFLGTPATPMVGWILHFVIGTVLWGGAFAMIWPRWPGDKPAIQAIGFSVLAWLLMMIIMMPLAGTGFFGLRIGVAAPIATLVLHVFFGAVLGTVFGKLASTEISSQYSRL